MISYGKKKIELLNQETLAYIEKGAGEETLLLIHGNMASSVHMVTLMDELQDKYRVIAPDLRGFGDSTFHNEFLSLKELAFDLMLFLNELDIDKVHVIGWSTGFGVAMELAIMHPDLVQSLFSIEGMPVNGYYSLRKDRDGNDVSSRVFDSYLEMSQDPTMRTIPDALAQDNFDLIKYVWENTLLVVKKVDDDLLDLYVRETLKQRCQMSINWIWVNFNISDAPNPYSQGNSQMHNIQCPIYLTVGKKDNVVTEQMIQQNIDLLDNPTVYVFENSGHCLHYDELDKIVEIMRGIY